MSETIGALLAEAARALDALPHAEPRLEAELLLAEAAAVSRERLIAWPERALDHAAEERFRSLVERRLGGEPIAYIRGRQGFWSLELGVSRDTLIPRPDTELLVETALALLPEDAPLRVADAGTGTGAVAAALALERPGWTLIALERSAAAAAVARENLLRWAPSNSRLVRCDWLAPLAPGGLDALVSNPPYVREDDPHLDQGDLPFEPRQALAAGPDGLDAIRRLSRDGCRCLRPGGLIALEHGWDQGEAVRDILAADSYVEIETRRDLAGHERVTLGRLEERTGSANERK